MFKQKFLEILRIFKNYFNWNQTEWRLGMHNPTYQTNKKGLIELQKQINPQINETFYQHKMFQSYVEKHISIYQHPIIYKKIDHNTYHVVNLTSSPRNIKINNDIVKVIEIGKYNKNGSEYTQYITKAICEVKITQKNFNLLIKDISENPGVKGLTKQQLKEINEIISNKIENNPDIKKYGFIDYHQKNIISYYKKWVSNQEEVLTLDKLEEE